MTKFVDIEPGQWVLAWKSEYFPPGDTDLARHAESLRFGGSGWEHLYGRSQFDVLLVTDVKPKTFYAVAETDGAEDPAVVRAHRETVLAVGKSKGAMKALGAKLMAIGHEADDAIMRERAKLIAPFERAKRDEAVAKIRALLPHLYGEPK